MTASRSVVGAAFTVLFVTTGVNSAFGILFKRILAELGGNRATLALAASAGLGVNALGQPFLGALIDRVGPRRVIFPAMALMALGTGLVSLGQHAWHLHGTIFGTANLFHHLSGALGAYAGGLAFDLAGSYRPIFVASGLLIVGAAAITALAGRDRPTHGPL